MNEPIYYTVSSAARYLEKSSQSIRAWVKNGKLSCSLAAGGIRIFHRADLEKLKHEIESRARVATKKVGAE